MKFKIGDKVRTTKDFDTGTKEGLVGKVVSFEKTHWGDVGVEFDEKVCCGHDCKGTAKYGYGRWGQSNGLVSVPVNTKKIVITSDGTETLARLYDGNKVIKTATAKCSPEDTFVFEEGARIALHRMLGDYAEVKAEKPHKYKAGDKVKVIANTCYHGMNIGGIVTLDRTLDADGDSTRWLTKEHNTCWYIRERDFEPYKFKFEVGKQYAYNDCVIEITSARIDECNCRRYDYKEIKGKTGLIKNFTENSTFGNTLKPYEPPKRYNGKVVCVKSPYPWWTVGKVYEVVNGKIRDNRGKIYPQRDGDGYRDAEDVRHAGDNCPLRRQNKENEFIPFVE